MEYDTTSEIISTRIPRELFQKICEQCNKIGCSINDYLQACIELGATGHTDFDFGDSEK